MSDEQRRRLAAISNANLILQCVPQLTEQPNNRDQRARIAQLVEWAELVIQQAICSDGCPPRFAGSGGWQQWSN